MAAPALRVGLTGGIACGKSEVLRRLAAAGLRTLDLDRVAHDVMAPGGAAYAEVVASFGPGILRPDRTIDRRVLGASVFENEEARRRLDGIVHPRVRAEEARLTRGWLGEPGAVVVTDAALLVEAGQHLRFDRLVVVHCRPEVQLERLMARDGIAEEAALGRLRAQIPIEEKRRFAHLEVDTNGTLDETRSRADDLARELVRLAGEARPRVKLERARVMGSLHYGPRRGPRGLDPGRVALEMGRAGELAMAGLASLLQPPHRGPWYRAARPDEGPPGPEALAGPIALWCLTRGEADEDYLLAAAASVARLTHPAPDAMGNACVLALALLAAGARGEGAGGEGPAPLVARLERWRSKAARWAGGTFPDRTLPVLRAAAEHPVDLVRARALCAASGGDPDLVGALVGLDAGAPEGGWPPEIVAAGASLLGAGERTGDRADEAS